jgi:hypothetical protein
MAGKFIILRREIDDGYSTRGPVAHAMSIDEARAEIARLTALYPHQQFVIMGEVGEARRSERVTVKIAAPNLPTSARKKRKLEGNVVALPEKKTG